nr:AMP-dependent synthetase and ligase [uncultured bacterium]
MQPRVCVCLIEKERGHRMSNPDVKTLHGLFEEQVTRTPNAVALVFEAQQLSYAELNERANRVARRLRSMGVGPGMFVGLYFERSWEMLVGMLGILKAGGAYVPLDPSYPAERLDYILNDARIEILLTQNHLASPASGRELRRLCLDSDWELIAEHNGENLSEETLSESLAYVIYTSGSTGRPKGVQIPHRAVVNMLDSMRRQPGLSELDTVLARTRLSFDMSVFEVFLPLVVGARLVIAGSEVVGDGGRLSQMLAACGATAMVATPATWLMLIEAGWQGQSGFKILCGGEAMSRNLADQLLERGAELWNLYGPTETAVWSTLVRVYQGDGLPVIGGPIHNTQLYVLDQNFSLAPTGMSGELCIGGFGLAHGYLNRPDLTAEKFISDPFSHISGARLYRTGDAARVLPDGNIEFIGRLDHQVKLRGFRIELGEIESVFKEHPAIRESAVILGGDTEGDKRLIAYLVTDNGVELAGSELRHFLQEKLPAYMIPSEFVSLDQMPLTPNGKVDRQALPALAGKQHSREKNYVIPRTPLENNLADIWAEVLQLKRVGADDNFFELGGHSLTATRVISQIRDRLQTEISLQEFFNSPTVAELAQRIEIGTNSEPRERLSSIVPVPRVRVKLPRKTAVL